MNNYVEKNFKLPNLIQINKNQTKAYEDKCLSPMSQTYYYDIKILNNKNDDRFNINELMKK